MEENDNIDKLFIHFYSNQGTNYSIQNLETEVPLPSKNDTAIAVRKLKNLNFIEENKGINNAPNTYVITFDGAYFIDNLSETDKKRPYEFYVRARQGKEDREKAREYAQDENIRLTKITNESIVDLNKETKTYYEQQDKTNKSVVDLNTETKSYYTKQNKINEAIVYLNYATKNITKIIAVTTIVSAIFTGLSYFKNVNIVSKLQDSLLQEKNTTTYLSKMLQYHIKIDSLFQKAVKDSLGMK
jgi:hypothetical protein